MTHQRKPLHGAAADTDSRARLLGDDDADNDNNAKGRAPAPPHNTTPVQRGLMFLGMFALAGVFYILAPSSSVPGAATRDDSGQMVLLHNASIVYTLAGRAKPPFDYNVGAIERGGVLLHGSTVGKVYRTRQDVEHAVQLLGGRSAIKLIDLQGGYVYPGFTDAHGVLRTYVNEAVTREKARRASDIFNDQRWLIGIAWDQTKWDPAEFPTKDDIDADPVLRSIPVMLQRVDIHAYWVNQRALELLDQQLLAPDHAISGGKIVRNPTDNLPTGIFVDNAMEIVERKVPPPTVAQLQEQMQQAIQSLHKFGVTGVHEAGLVPAFYPSLKLLAGKAAEGSNVYAIRQYAMVRCPDLRAPSSTPDTIIGAPYPTYCGDLDGVTATNVGNRFILRSVKLFLDGALGSYGASLIEPYSDDNSTTGILRCEDTVNCAGFAHVVEKWLRKGFQVSTHAIGDRANRIVLDGYEQAIRKLHSEGKDTSDLRLRIEHAQIMRPEDIKRCAEVGVIPSMQPTHATSDMSYAEARLGPKRILGAYAWQSLLTAGVPALPLSSDFPVESPDPLLGFYAAVTRKFTDGTWPGESKDGWYPEQKLSRAQALHGFTMSAAYAAFLEDKLGSIQVGKLADIVVLDRDIMTVPERDILAAQVKATVFDGRCVYGPLCPTN
ncbi:hypothetical protein RI367_008217 [Sorochytrium milnesiophthora]